MSQRYVLLLGSNVDKELNVPRATLRLEAEPDIEILDRSGTYESDPVGAPDTPRFHNRALLVETTLTLDELRLRIRAIEAALGRERQNDRNAPRTIDIDLIFAMSADHRVLETPPPDPDLGGFHHIGVPVMEVAGHARLPSGERVAEHAATLASAPSGFVRYELEVLRPPADCAARLLELEVVLDETQWRQLGIYLSLLLETNRRFNLTAIRNPEDAWPRHVLDSLTLCRPLRFVLAENVIDVGSGGGLPGVPLAIALPEMRFTLLESVGKKARFLESVVRHLELDNVRVLTARAEDVAQEPEHREQYDVALARAVGPLPVLLELTVPLVQIGGTVLAIKGQQAEAEVEAARSALYQLHAHVAGIERNETGSLVLIEKTRKTPRRFPRKSGEPKRAPLGQ